MVTFERVVSTEGVGKHIAVVYKESSCEVMTEDINHAEKFGTTGKKNQAGSIGEIMPVGVPKIEKIVACL